MGNFIVFMREVANELRENGNQGTAHVYYSSLNAIIAFQGNERLSFQEITPEWLKRFEGSIRARGCSWNTVSTYLRTLRAVYNRAIDRRKANYVPHLFRSVYTGTRQIVGVRWWTMTCKRFSLQLHLLVLFVPNLSVHMSCLCSCLCFVVYLL